MTAKASDPALFPYYSDTPLTSELGVELEGPGGEMQSLSKDLIISKDWC